MRPTLAHAARFGHGGLSAPRLRELQRPEDSDRRSTRAEDGRHRGQPSTGNLHGPWMKRLEGRAPSRPQGARVWSLSKPKACGNSRRTRVRRSPSRGVWLCQDRKFRVNAGLRTRRRSVCAEFVAPASSCFPAKMRSCRCYAFGGTSSVLLCNFRPIWAGYELSFTGRNMCNRKSE